MRAWALVAVTIVVFSGCAGSEEVQDFGTVEAPTMEAGYAYAYDVMGSGSFEASVKVDGEALEDESDSFTLPQTPLYVMQILNTSFGPNGSYYLAAARFGGHDADPFGGGAVLGKVPVAIRKADLAPFQVSVTQAQSCIDGCRLSTKGMEVTGETPLDPYLAFPLQAGKTWSNRVDLGFGLDQVGMEMLVASKVMGKESVEGPDGPVDAVRIQHTLSLPESLVDGLKFALESQGFEDTYIDFAMDGRVDTFYAETFQSIVREHAKMTLTLDLAFTHEGQRFETNVYVDQDITMLLSAADLTAEAERTADEVYAFFDGAQQVKTPGEEIDVGAYTIRVSADAAEINVAETDMIAFTVDSTPALPDGDQIRYTVSDALGNLVDGGTGDAFEVSFEDAGLYQVIVQAINDQGVIQAVDGMAVAADLQTTYELTCGNAILSAVPNSGSCTAADIPLKNDIGLQDVSITINADNPASYGGTLMVTDADDKSVEKDADDGEGFTLDDLSGLAIGPWKASWHRDAALLEEASISVVLDYGPDTSVPEEADAGMRFTAPFKLVEEHLLGLRVS